MTEGGDWSALLEIFRELGLERVLGRDRDLVMKRLFEMTASYEQKLVSTPPDVLSPMLKIGDIVREYRRNPHRVAPVLQALAFNCSATMLAMMWMVQIGARVAAIDYKFDRGRTSHLSVTIELPDRETHVRFDSDEHWDLAVLRLAGISKGDDLPLVESFYALR